VGRSATHLVDINCLHTKTRPSQTVDSALCDVTGVVTLSTRHFGEDRVCSSGDMIADRQTHTHRQTDTLITILRAPLSGAE